MHRIFTVTRQMIAVLVVAVCAFTRELPAQVLNKQNLLDRETFWDNRDWDWYKANIPFFDCPDTNLTTTWYYRWELVTKHLTYGSPNSGYSFTEFIDRPFWSGAHGAISCPAGHQLYEVRWLRDPRYARDYSRYWFRTPDAQPRRYGSWIADAIWAAHMVHPDAAFIKDLLPDLKRNYDEWEKRQFVPQMGLFWQNGHDDGMEYNITSRQTQDIVRGANGYRPSFNSYMYADALAIARVARLAGDTATAAAFEAKAASLKQKVQKLLWDPSRQFFFPMFMRDETDKEGNVVKANTLTYQSGKFAGNPHGREEIGFVPWQFNLPDPGYEPAWKFLMDPNFFFAEFGPSTVERNDPMFLLRKTCCWWSGQSWPYATTQTLQALANLLHNYKQNVITRADYFKLLQVYTRTHRKNGRPYIAEAAHPDTGSWEGHDSYNHSEHYFHSGYNDLIITGLIGIKPSAGDMLEIDPLAPPDWPYFAIDDLAYHGHSLTVLWDKSGARYKRGRGLRVFSDGKELAALNALGKIKVNLSAATSGVSTKTVRINYAVNNDGDSFPKMTASYNDPSAPLSRINDGNFWYHRDPPNRWTCHGSTNAADLITLDLGTPRKLDSVKLYFLDDGTNILAPAAYTLEFWNGQSWENIPAQQRTPRTPTGHRANVVQFAARDLQKLRCLFTHSERGKTGLTEIEAWGDGTLPYTPPAPPRGNLALNQTGQGFPRARASFSDRFGGQPNLAIDGKVIFRSNPMNRWTSFGSTNLSDWFEVDFGEPKQVGRVELYLYNDRGGVQAPASYSVQYFAENEWKDVLNQIKSPERPRGSDVNTVTFAPVKASKVRIVFVHNGKARTGLTEIEVWGENSPKRSFVH
jgi:hypothetical protein